MDSCFHKRILESGLESLPALKSCASFTSVGRLIHKFLHLIKQKQEFFGHGTFSTYLVLQNFMGKVVLPVIDVNSALLTVIAGRSKGSGIIERR